jgi:hypothetical protein
MDLLLFGCFLMGGVARCWTYSQPCLSYYERGVLCDCERERAQRLPAGLGRSHGT